MYRSILSFMFIHVHVILLNYTHIYIYMIYIYKYSHACRLWYKLHFIKKHLSPLCHVSPGPEASLGPRGFALRHAGRLRRLGAAAGGHEFP